jgi:hypothetical protein
MIAGMELMYSANDCELAELKKLQEEPWNDAEAACQAFYALVCRIQVSVVYTYRITAFSAVREKEAKKAAELWKALVDYCEKALTIIYKLKEIYPKCGALELYDLVLNYREEAESRYRQNLQDSECADPEIMRALFPKKS